MWILNFLPVWVAYVIVLVGASGLVISIFTGVFARFIPSLHAIKLPLQLVSVAVLLFGVFLTGGIANQKMWEERVKEMEQKVLIAEQKSKETNTQIEYKYVDRVRVVQDVQWMLQEKIKEVEKIIDAKCEVPQEAIGVLNSAAKNSSK